MSEKTIAARIKMARKMAGLSTQASLLEKIPNWSASRLGNYEAGISTPGPDDIILIAKATDSSPCWLMFGLGPIRPNARDLQAIRHQNLSNTVAELEEQKGGINRLTKALDISHTELENYIENPFQILDDELAKKYQTYLKLPDHWMDEQHVEHDPICLSFPQDIQELISLFSSQNQTTRKVLLSTLKTLIKGLEKINREKE